MKLLVKIIIGALVVLVLVIGAAFFFLDLIARGAIEGGATYALGVPTTLAKADVGVLRGEFTMSGLDVANPEGFQGEHFFTLGSGHVAVSLGTLRSDTVELPILALSDIELTLEKTGDKANYRVIADNLKRFESDDDGVGGEPTEPEPEEDDKGYVIHEVVLTNINVNADMGQIGGELSRVRVPIGEIRLENVGSAEGNAVSMGEMVDIIMKAVFAAVIANGADFPADLVKDLDGSLAGLASLSEMGVTQEIGAAQDIAGAIKAIDDGDVDKGVNDLVDGVGGLLGGKKD